MASDKKTKIASPQSEDDGMTKYAVSPEELTKEATEGVESEETSPDEKKKVKKTD